jgi:hypothetical protein
LSTVDLSEGLLSIGHSAFHGCSDLIRINIPSTVRIIECGSFAECEKLSQVILSEGLESIQGEAFYGCTSLETIVIPSTVREIAEDAFYGCTSLKLVKSGADK